MQRWPGCGICRAGRVSLWRGKQIPPLPHASACPSASPQKPLAVPVSSLAGMPVPSQYSPTVAQSGLATAPLCKSQYNPFYRTLVPVQRYYISSTSQYSCVDFIQLPVQHIRTCTGPNTAHYGSYWSQPILLCLVLVPAHPVMSRTGPSPSRYVSHWS